MSFVSYLDTVGSSTLALHDKRILWLEYFGKTNLDTSLYWQYKNMLFHSEIYNAMLMCPERLSHW